MFPPNNKARIPTGKDGRRMSTNNARTETMATSWTFRLPWQDGNRCLIPCDSYDEPYWGTGKNIWWHFRGVDGKPWAIAGLWNKWTARRHKRLHCSRCQRWTGSPAEPLRLSCSLHSRSKKV